MLVASVKPRFFFHWLAAVSLVAACLVPSSCLGKISLESYLRNLDAIRSQSDAIFSTIEGSIENIASGPTAAQSLYDQMDKANAVIEKCQEEIQKLEAPEQARKLHALIVEMFDESAGFFSDIKSMMEYSSKRAPIIAAFENSSRELDSRIAANPSPAGVSAALADSSSKTDAVKAELAKLSPPRFLKEMHKALMEMMSQYSESLLELKAAVESGNAAGIQAAQAKVRQALSGNLAEETRKSIEAYNGRIEKIEKLRKQANQEETRITSGQ
jgi:hypothetical protein